MQFNGLLRNWNLGTLILNDLQKRPSTSNDRQEPQFLFLIALRAALVGA